MNKEDLGQLPLINPRSTNLENAGKVVREFLLETFAVYDLTTSERLFLLMRELDFRVAGCVSQEHREFAQKESERETFVVTPKKVEPKTFTVDLRT